MRHVGGDDVEAFDPVITGFQALEAPVAQQTLGADRKMRGTHGAPEHLDRVGAVLVRDEHPDACIGAVAGSEERQPLHVVPVQMAQQDGAVKRATLELAGESPQPGARVEHERPRLAVVRQRDARRVPAHAHEVATRRGR